MWKVGATLRARGPRTSVYKEALVKMEPRHQKKLTKRERRRQRNIGDT